MQPRTNFVSYRFFLLCLATVLAGVGNSAAQLRDTTFNAAIRDTVPSFHSYDFIAFPYPDHRSMLFHIPLPEERTVIERDSTGKYISRRYLFDVAVGMPYRMNFEEFAERNRRESIRQNWRQISNEYENTRRQRRGLLDLRFDVPGGNESTFTTIFGKPEVNLRVNGTANMNLGASIQKTDNPEIPPDQQTQVDPTFEQNLKLNIQGTIGDKLSIQTDWDTERAFDFMNRLSIVYQGYEDEILQRIEMGNVSMETGNSLIRGGSALFGVKSIAQIGSLRLTSVLSQQEGEGRTETITGGAQEQQISIRPADYQNDRHFFLDFYNRQEFESNMSNPQQLGQAYQLSEINVWILRESTQSFEGERQAIALVDLGVVENVDGSYALPDENQDPFDDATLDQFRDPSQGASAQDFGIEPEEFVEGYFIPLQEGVDYEVNRYLGYVSLKRNLGSRQALAISFKYLDPETGQTVSVGDISQGGGDRIFLKLIRPQNATTTNKAWDLMMKNVYSIGASNLTPENLEVDIKYTEQNVPRSSLPQRNTILLQDLGLDRVDNQGALNPDNRIDFSTGTLDPASGTIVFPYLEPFGDRVESLLSSTGLTSEQIADIAFNELYEEKKVNANQFSKNNFYLLEGSSKGTVSENYSLGISLVEGSVTVLANGKELQEGTDYVVDYSIGSITILDEQYLRKGQEIKIEYENNQFAQIEQKSFTGLRAEYEVNENIRFGSTYFRLKEKPLQDKIRIGDEPVNNAVIGFDANARFDAPWLTRVIDRVPLLQTNAPSSFSLSGEFAQLRPGVAQTNAVEDAIDRGDLFEDEENGLSFIDDFEGVDIGLSFMNPSRWNLAAAPAAVPGYAPDQSFFEDNPPANPSNTLADKIARSDLRSQFSWYTIPQNINEILNGVQLTPESQPVRVTDVFPNRDVLSEENFLSTLDVYYDPQSRGPYNYNLDLRNVLENEPERTWGGMVATLPSGQEDLTQNNIEFLEFWVQPLLPAGRQPNAQDLQDYDGKIYIDIGIVSEDVVPNFKTNTEDGLTRRPDDLEPDNFGNNARSYIPIPPPPPEGQFSNERRQQEDVGLDGVPNTDGIGNRNEQNLFNSFLSAMQSAYGIGNPNYTDIENDPSNDDYVYYGEDQVADRPLHERFHRMYGYHDGNTPPNNSEKRALTNKPDTEGLITPSIVEQNNSYFQYEVSLNPADIVNLNVGSPGTYIVDKVPGPTQQDRWYQVRIPLQDWIRKVGSIESFQNISYIRLWLSGYEEPLTLRFATFELVGSQWRNAENVNGIDNSMAEFNISSINIEENSQRQPIPYRQPEGAIRATNRSQQRQTIANEQSIVLDVEDLGPQELKMVKRVYPGGLNMINYSNVRMFVHGEGFDNRGDAELVLRFGTDLTNNYYEYRQPISPTDENYPFSNKPLSELTEGEREQEAEEVWLYDQNSVNILLRAFNQLKQLRDQQQNDPSQVYERGDLLDEAPPGAVIAIKGNPSLDRVGEIGMGLRNPYDTANPGEGVQSLDAQVWLNELRVSGFDNQTGWAANAKAELRLADFATVNANFNRETDGFGALDSRLGQRRISDVYGYDLNSSVNLHKFIPDRYGWNIPVSLSTRRSVSTPRYLPNQGDVRLSEFEDAVNARDDLSDNQKEQLIDDKIRESQTFLESYSINLSNVGKRLSENKIAEYTLDKTTVNFVYNTTERRNPEYRFQDNWNYNGSVRYNLNFRNTQLFEPFGFLDDVPLLNAVSGLKLGYTPAAINASAGVDRSYDEQRRRSFAGQQENALQQSHSFSYNTSFGFNYNLTPSVKTTFRTRSVFDLSRAGIEENGIPGSVDSTRFRVIPTFTVLDGLITDTLSSRRSNYEEGYTASWQPRLNQFEPISWISYSANYGGGYQWRNSPLGSGLGATVSNNLNLNQSLELDMSDLFGRMEWYRRLVSEDSQNDDMEGQTTVEQDTTASPVREQDLGRDLAYVGKKALQALLSIQSFDISLNLSKNSQQSGYAGNAPFYQMFRQGGDNFSPPFSYRTGINDEIGLTQLIDNPNENSTIQIPSNKRLSNDLTIGSRLLPFDNISIDLTWNAQWDNNQSRSITIYPDESSSTVRTQSGNISSSVWAFGGGYESLFKKQLRTAYGDINAQNDSLSDALGNRDGRTVLGKGSLQDDFRKAYLGIGTGAVGKRNFTPFPLPGWRITWTGVEKIIPYLGQFMARASISHSYRGAYRLGWTFNATTEPFPPFQLGAYTVLNRRPEYEPNSVNIEKNFSPLIGLNITWESNLRTNIQYEYSKITSLALSNTTVTERYSKGFRFTFSYTVRNFKLPFFARLDNAVDFTINTSFIEDIEQKYSLDSDLEDELQEGHGSIIQDVETASFDPSFTGGQSRINGSAIIGYQFSQTIKANFEYTYSRLIPKSTGVFPRTDHDIRFNVIVSIRSD